MILSRGLFFLTVFSAVFGDGMVCNHKDDEENAVHGVVLDPDHVAGKRAASAPIRISPYYDASISQLTAAVRTRIQNSIVPKLIDFLRQTLQVQPVSVPILLDRQCSTTSFYVINGFKYCATTCRSTITCGQATVPSSHLQVCRQCNGGTTTSSCITSGTAGTGVANTDFVLYVSAANTSPCSTGTAGAGTTTLAFATYCQTESTLDRPIAGNINFCPGAFSLYSDDSSFLAVAKHESLHALAFTTGLFPFWRDQTGAPRTLRDPTTKLPPIVNGAYQASTSTVKSVTYTNWAVSSGAISHPVTLLVTPAVLATARAYFNCLTLAGAELENQGGSGTALSHWEKRIFGNELMTGITSFNPLFSILTLAALQDSGWYQVNTSMSERLVWGYGAGCPFASGSCGGYINNQMKLAGPIDPFCNTNSASGINMLGCTIERRAVSYCNLVAYSSALPADYQYFSSLGSGAGGAVQIADFYPFQDVFTYSGSGRGTTCTNVTNNLANNVNYLAETYGPKSVCLNHGSVGWKVTISSSIITPGTTGAGCYEFVMFSDGTRKVTVLGKDYFCTTTGQQINVDVTVSGIKYQGSILCPAPQPLGLSAIPAFSLADAEGAAAVVHNVVATAIIWVIAIHTCMLIMALF